MTVVARARALRAGKRAGWLYVTPDYGLSSCPDAAARFPSGVAAEEFLNRFPGEHGLEFKLSEVK